MYTLFAHAPLSQESWGLGYYSKLLRFTNPYTSLRYLPFELLCARASYPRPRTSTVQTFVFVFLLTVALKVSPQGQVSIEVLSPQGQVSIEVLGPQNQVSIEVLSPQNQVSIEVLDQSS